MADRFRYVGTELELFAEAVQWKQYFASQLRPFILGDVLEVGAGLGGTTKVLCQGAIDSWTCLEPDAALAGQLQAISDEPHLKTRPIQVKAGTLADLPLDARFDSILYIDVLEHIE